MPFLPFIISLLKGFVMNLISNGLKNINIKDMTAKIGMSKMQLAAMSVMAIVAIWGLTSAFGNKAEIAELNRQLLISSHNVAALQDSTRMLQNEAGEWEAVRLAMIADHENLAGINNELVAEIEKERGKVKTITQIETRVERDTVYLDNEIFEGGGYYTLSWTNRNSFSAGNSRFLSGYSRFQFDGNIYNDQTVITEDVISMSLISGIKQRDDGMLESFVRTAYPGVTFNTQSMVVDPAEYATQPAEKKWALYAQTDYYALDNVHTVGLGLSRGRINLDANYDYLNESVTFDVGLTQNIINW